MENTVLLSLNEYEVLKERIHKLENEVTELKKHKIFLNFYDNTPTGIFKGSCYDDDAVLKLVQKIYDETDETRKLRKEIDFLKLEKISKWKLF